MMPAEQAAQKIIHEDFSICRTGSLPNIDKRYKMAIISFKCPETQRLFMTGKTRRFANIQAVAERKLAQLDAATTLEFLRSPPGNRMEALTGDRRGQHSIRINDQWRVCFVWTGQDVADAEIVDYH